MCATNRYIQSDKSLPTVEYSSKSRPGSNCLYIHVIICIWCKGLFLYLCTLNIVPILEFYIVKTLHYHIYPCHRDRGCIVFTVSIGTPQFLTTLVLKFGKVHFLTCLCVLNISVWVANSVRPGSDATFCSIWSGYALFAQVCLSQNLGLLQ